MTEDNLWHNKTLFAVCLGLILLMTGVQSPTPILPEFVLALGVAPAQIGIMVGLVIAILGVGRVVINLPAAKIAKHLGIASIPNVRYDWGIKMEPEVAGQIKLASPIRCIQIPFFYVGKKYEVGGILAHEMTHAFLTYNGILLEDPNENEMFTDLAAVFIGLGKLLLNGLLVALDEHLSEGHGLGYLSPESIVYCYKRVNAYRSISEEAATKNLTPEATNRLSNFRIN